MSAAQHPDPLDLHPSRLGPMSTRLVNILDNENIRTVRALCSYTAQRLLTVPNCGKKRVEEVRELLATHGLALAEMPHRDGTLPMPFPSVHQRLTRIEQRLDEIEGALKAHWLKEL